MKIYTLNPIDNQYMNSEDVVIGGGKSYCNQYFPIQQCQQKKLILIKNGNSLIFVKVILPFKEIIILQKKIISISKLADIFKNEKSLDFLHYQIYGTLSKD
ncbi:unnamed protein product [Paramecium pentaurelia]|uniref:Uncharacterized protein n=1 Tax=Paramecium pentaurelia TaxID=43138 RepID=A0A8S1ULM2_9CILI|nr:unnamed protein product [Paramecium pentaurelia]